MKKLMMVLIILMSDFALANELTKDLQAENQRKFGIRYYGEVRRPVRSLASEETPIEYFRRTGERMTPEAYSNYLTHHPL